MATEQRAGGPSATEGVARFELAPPRRFMLPAILLLLSEQPGYGYGLVPRLVEFRFGHVDRPGRLPGSGPARARWAGAGLGGRPPARPGAPRLLGDAAGGACAPGVDGGHPGGARAPGRGHPALPGDRHDRRGPVRGRGRMGARTGPGLVTRVDDVDVASTPDAAGQRQRRRDLSPRRPGGRIAGFGPVGLLERHARRVRGAVGCRPRSARRSPAGLPRWAGSSSIPRDRRCSSTPARRSDPSASAPPGSRVRCTPPWAMAA